MNEIEIYEIIRECPKFGKPYYLKEQCMKCQHFMYRLTNNKIKCSWNKDG